MADIGYIFENASTGQVARITGLYDTSFGDGLFYGYVNLGEQIENKYTIIDVTNPGKCYLSIKKDDFCTWKGIITSRTYRYSIYKNQTGTMLIRAEDVGAMA